MPLSTLTPSALTRFNALFRAGVSYRDALALADRITETDLAAAISGIGGGGGAVSSVAGRTGAVTLTKTDVGLANVDNTPDATKPVSTAQSAAISAAIANLVNSAPGTMDTLGEIAALLASDESTAAALATTVAGKMAKSANGSDIAVPATFRTNLGLGSAALSPSSAFDASGAAAAAQAASFSLNPTQRGVWAPTTVYNVGELVVSPTGDIITPKVNFTSGATYSAANWNILVPAPNYGRELGGNESTTDMQINGLSGWQDYTGMTMTVPAGIPYWIQATGLTASVQGTVAAGAGTKLELRIVDSATATTTYLYGYKIFYWPVAGQAGTQWIIHNVWRRQPALGSATTMKLQLQSTAVTGQGNIGMFPAAGTGGAEPTTMMAIGR